MVTRSGPDRHHGQEGQNGSVLLTLVILVFLTFVLFAGIVADASRAQHANAHAADMAAKAARFGAQEIDPASIRSGKYRLDPIAARTAASTYLARHHLTGDITTNGRRISVTVSWPVRFRVLALLRQSVTITQTRTVALTTGP